MGRGEEDDVRPDCLSVIAASALMPELNSPNDRAGWPDVRPLRLLAEMIHCLLDGDVRLEKMEVPVQRRRL